MQAEMGYTERCVTVIPVRPDGSTECEHIGEEHSDLGALGFGQCEIEGCWCIGYVEEGVEEGDLQRAPLTLAEAELLVGEPATEWGARCFEMATKLEDAYRGSAVYGHWIGPVSPSSIFGYRAVTGFVQHGWIEMSDGSVVDPTRWCFEAVDPYIYVGPNDHYDRGGNALRMRMAGPAPLATTEPGTALIISTPAAVTMVFAMTGWRDLDNLSDEQLRWLAHMSPEVYGFEHARVVFQALADAGEQARIPIDNWRWAMEEPLFSGSKWGEDDDDES